MVARLRQSIEHKEQVKLVQRVRAFYPDVLHLIVGLDGGEPDLRAFSIRDGEVADVALSVV